MNGTIKVVCYKYKTLSNGESPLMIRVCKDGKRYLGLRQEELLNTYDCLSF